MKKSGRHIITDAATDEGRRRFLAQVAALFALPLGGLSVAGCKSANGREHITGRMVETGSKVGHMLRDGVDLTTPTRIIQAGVLIVGGGIAGLSAARWLRRAGVDDVMCIEMADCVGGNSCYGTNSISSYPWAAHYLPIPDPRNTELIDFLREAGTITSIVNGVPHYNEFHLCHDPEERLFIDGYWQEGLVPRFGNSKADDAEVARFFTLVNDMKSAKGADGKFAFDIPVDFSSAEPAFRSLDSISFRQYLSQHGFQSERLLWYLDYCCKDDYGSGLDHTSAWAGLHYFAARRGRAANAPSSAVLTWPEGNGFLMDALRVQSSAKWTTNIMVLNVRVDGDKAQAICFDTKKKAVVAINADKILLCTPQYVNKHMLQADENRIGCYEAAEYAPWVVANVSYKGYPLEGRGVQLCWDNVLYGRDSVGYVVAGHQSLSPAREGVFTWYYPVANVDPSTGRRQIYDKPWTYWRDKLLADLSSAHPHLAQSITNIDVKVWGHGMIRPSPGYVWGGVREKATTPVDNRIFFAHSDLSGISIFEEAFYQGIRAAKEILQNI